MEIRDSSSRNPESTSGNQKSTCRNPESTSENQEYIAVLTLKVHSFLFALERKKCLAGVCTLTYKHKTPALYFQLSSALILVYPVKNLQIGVSPLTWPFNWDFV